MAIASKKLTNGTKELSSLKVAIVHDWLYGGGAELVVEELHKMFPSAPIYVSWSTDEWRQRLDNKVVTGFLQYWPFRKFYKYLGFLRIFWYTCLNLTSYDLVISSSGAEAKGIKTSKDTLHVNYCHAPTHYYWSRYNEYMQNPGFGSFNWLARIGLKILVNPLRKWDYKASHRPDYMIANSSHIKSEIKKYYKRDSIIIFPPVNTKRFQKPQNSNLKRHGYLIAGRQTPYKRFDLAIKALSLLNLPLNVVGDGPDNKRLKGLSGKTINFLGKISNEELEKQFASANAFIFPGIDDFGITPVEAMSAGTPVIAYKGGGALDYIKPGITGEFFNNQTVESLSKVVKNFDPKIYSSQKIKSFSKNFSPQNFQKEFKKYLLSIINEKSS